VRAAEAVRVPAAFVRRLSPAFIKRWLGGRLPLLATPLEPLFARLSVAELETARRPGRLAPLFRDAGESAPALDAQLVAAFAEAAEEEAAAALQALVDAQVRSSFLLCGLPFLHVFCFSPFCFVKHSFVCSSILLFAYLFCCARRRAAREAAGE
jgi:hypothetical protein